LFESESDAVTIYDLIFTEDEEKAWFETEPDFTKRIATPTSTKRRLRGVSVSTILFNLRDA